MTVFVDDAGIIASVKNPENNRVHTSSWCHLFTDQDDQSELHAFATKIGLKRDWFQDHHADKPWMWHYDVTSGKRWQAIRAGAQQVTWQDAGRMMLKRARAYRERNMS